MVQRYDPITPGAYLQHEFLEPLAITQNQLSRDIDVPVSRINGIIAGTRAITADTALRLAEYFGTSPEMWLNLQTQYELRILTRQTWPAIQRRIRHCAALEDNRPHA
ncbi:MAG: HigA family addiction module antitoxin [Alphaproteobacteria bacterium]|nr:HigA family addiction module antitoxin [Alphaproteobacteria bacterium]